MGAPGGANRAITSPWPGPLGLSGDPARVSAADICPVSAWPSQLVVSRYGLEAREEEQVLERQNPAESEE